MCTFTQIGSFGLFLPLKYTVNVICQLIDPETKLMNKTRECLIIDDDPDDQEIFLMCLKKISSDVNCTTANNGIEAVSLLKTNPEYNPHYIFIDVNMPKMNGIDCLKILKNMARLEYTKIFMYSTTSETNTVTKSMELGAEEFIIKPSSIVLLKEKLAKIFDVVTEISKYT
jgi:response regulator RpfG family c-di-GMP phosphodiesterase